MNCVLVNGSNRVVDENWWAEDGKGKYFDVMVLVFIECANALRVNDENVNFFSILSGTFDGISPAPEPFGVRINGGSDSKSIVPIEKDAIKKIGLASSV